METACERFLSETVLVRVVVFVQTGVGDASSSVGVFETVLPLMIFSGSHGRDDELFEEIVKTLP